jgi:ubiquitin C-terminal hydrolase
METCSHQPVYFAAVNININERTIGSVDVWRCGVCKKKFCEEKQLGIETLTDIVGMPKIESDEKWAVSVCKLQKGKDKWHLVKLKENSEINHECLDEKIIALKVKDYKIEDDSHWSFLVEDHHNRAVEI